MEKKATSDPETNPEKISNKTTDNKPSNVSPPGKMARSSGEAIEKIDKCSGSVSKEYKD
jgi:hypothetical protein